MFLEEIIKPESVLCNAQARSKKHCLEILSELLVRANPDISNELIFENLIVRERLGCTSLGKGVAFPHCRVDGLGNSTAALIKLSEPVDFEAGDGKPVDLVFGLIVPKDLQQCHHTDISMITEMLKDEGLRGRLRASNSSSDLYKELLDAALLSTPDRPVAALGA